jgi:hypothetical protein
MACDVDSTSQDQSFSRDDDANCHNRTPNFRVQVAERPIRQAKRPMMAWHCEVFASAALLAGKSLSYLALHDHPSVLSWRSEGDFKNDHGASLRAPAFDPP